MTELLPSGLYFFKLVDVMYCSKGLMCIPIVEGPL